MRVTCKRVNLHILFWNRVKHLHRIQTHHQSFIAVPCCKPIVAIKSRIIHCPGHPDKWSNNGLSGILPFSNGLDRGILLTGHGAPYLPFLCNLPELYWSTPLRPNPQLRWFSPKINLKRIKMVIHNLLKDLEHYELSFWLEIIVSNLLIKLNLPVVN